MCPMICRAPLLTGILLLSTACTGADGAEGVAQSCVAADGTSYSPCRVFHGRLQLPPANQLHLQANGLQIAAVLHESLTAPAAPDGMVSLVDAGPAGADAGPAGADASAAADGSPAASAPTPRFAFGPPFANAAGGGLQASVPFAVVVPCETSVNLLLQVPRTSDAHAPGLMVAPMRFDPGDGGDPSTLIPHQPAGLCGAKTNQHDLGLVRLALGQAGVLESGQITLGQDGSRNPLELLDSDGDGTVDLADLDDDDDGVPDSADQDVAGNGVPDSAEQLSALPDADEDGRPDAFQ